MSKNSFVSDGQEPLPGLARAGVAHSGIPWSCDTTMETNEWIIPNLGNPDSVFFDRSPIPKSLGF